MTESRALCATCEYPMTKGKLKRIKIGELSRSSQQGCGICSLIKGTIYHLALKDRGIAIDKDASFFLTSDRRFQVIQIGADWFRNSNQYRIISNLNQNSSRLDDVAWERPQLESKLFGDPVSRAKQWLQVCINQHEECNQSDDPKLPSRVIQILSNGTKLRLVDGLGKAARYAALSHCWGKSKRIITDCLNFHQHKRDIPFSSLPKTFRDAVYMCHNLDIEYLWIDSICIIQDDREDWAREAAKMGSVYENAFLTLAASGAADDEGGFFLESNSPFLRWKGVPPHDMREALAFPKFNHPDELSLGSLEKEVPLHTRGWAFQERIFSRRFLEFGRQEQYWKCKAVSTCGCNSPLLVKELSLSVEKPSNLQSRYDRFSFAAKHTWQDFVTNYSPLKLSFPSDKLPAFSAIASKAAPFRDGQYLAGLWEDGLPGDLLWYIRFIPGPRPKVWRAPSWSWASTDSEVYFCTRGKDENIFYDMKSFECRILDAKCLHSGINKYGEVAKGAYLQILGRQVRTKLEALNGFHDGYDTFHWDIELAGDQCIEPDEDIFCLPMFSHAIQYMGPLLNYHERQYSALVIKCVDLEQRVFERIGLIRGFRESKKPWWWGDDEEDERVQTGEFTLV